MITGINGLFFTNEPEATREVLTEILEFDHHDAGDGWIVFDVPEASLGAHPLDEDVEPFHEMSFKCEDIEDTVHTIKEAGVEVTSPIEDKGFGMVTQIELPGGVPVELYEPHHG